MNNNTEEIISEQLEEEEEEDSKWKTLPDLLLERIFSHLSIRDRYYASLVCRTWHEAFYLPHVWSRFALSDKTLTRGRFNYYTGRQYVLDHYRTQMCLSQVGAKIRHLRLGPMLNFNNLFEFMNIVSWYIEHSKLNSNVFKGAACNIKTLNFTFPCNMSDEREQSERTRLFGTGGKLLDALKRLMRNLPKLRRLELIDLMLDPNEAQHLLDEVCEQCCHTLHTLMLINTTGFHLEILHPGVLLNLQVLVISPQNLGPDLIELLGDTRLRHLHLLQNRFTPTDPSIVRAVSANSWRICKRNNPHLDVHLQVEGMWDKEVVWQQCAPVRSVLYDLRHVKLNSDSLLTALDLYGKSLKTYGHKGLPRFHMPKPFHERIDNLLLLLCLQCPNLHTLLIRERVSTSTLLLLAYSGENLRNLYVRRNAVILRCDWPRNPDWSNEFFTWLTLNSRTYQSTENEVSQIFNKKWKMLTDKEYKNVPVNLYTK